MKIALVIPIYEPSEQTVGFLSGINLNDFDYALVVDDGSGPRYAPIFERINNLPSFHVVSYTPNIGKGHALKVAFAELSQRHADIDGIVTADGDGQHSLDDIRRVRDALRQNPGSLILGVRDFSLMNVPRHNRFGNRFSKLYFRLSTGVRVSDTQTGLRGIPAALLPLAIATEGNRYDYEMNFLSAAVKTVPVKEIAVATIYERNAKSHFNPIVDSLRIYRTLFSYPIVALVSWAIDLSLFALFASLIDSGVVYQVLLATVGARLISGTFNFAVNNLWVFPSKGHFWRKAARYAAIFFINMALSFALVYAFSFLSSELVLVKFVVDGCIFIANYFIELTWVFASGRHRERVSHGKGKRR